MSVNSRLKATEIIGQMKAFYRQRISGSSRAIKEFNIDIFVTSKNGDRKIMESISTKSKSSSFVIPCLLVTIQSYMLRNPIKTTISFAPVLISND